MFVELYSNHGIPSVRLVESVYKPGVVGGRKKYVATIGTLAALDDGKPDFMERLKKSFAAGNPIVKELEKYCNGNYTKNQVMVPFNLYGNDCSGEPLLFSHILIERILEELELPYYFRVYKNYHKINFDVLGFFRLLVYGRVLSPASKIATVRQKDRYFGNVLKSDYEYNVYDTLDFVYENCDGIFRIVNKNMLRKFNRDTSLIFYDVTNMYFEIEDPDPDTVDEFGNTVKGIRKMGVSKEEKSSPIVQMGLFMDRNGYPVAIEMFPGNTLDNQTVIPALSATIDTMKYDKFIFVGDRGVCTYPNLLHLRGKGHGYVVSRSIRVGTKADKAWLLNQDDYVDKSKDFKYKSRVVTKTVADEFGNKHTISEKEVVYWSRKFYNRQMKENKSFVDFYNRYLENPTGFRLGSTMAKKLRRFMRRECFDKSTGEVFDSSQLKMMLDTDKMKEYVDMFGYYKIITSETDMDDLKIIEIYHGLSEIEDQFRVMKNSLSIRPLEVRTPEHIKAHMIVCFLALLVIRIIQNKIKSSPDYVRKNKSGWETGMSAETLVTALNKWTVEEMPNGKYRFNFLNDSNINVILKAFDLEIPKILYSRSELLQLKSKIKV